jgi:uncharacterized protein
MVKYSMRQVEQRRDTGGVMQKMQKEKNCITLLAVSDLVEPHLYRPQVKEWLGPVDLIISCGDLPAQYLGFLVDAVDAPLYGVLGNHCCVPRQNGCECLCHEENYSGFMDLHGRVERAHIPGLVAPLTLAGVEGSPFYNGGPHQYSETAVKRKLMRLMPGLLHSRLKTGRYLDIFVTHAPARGIHDMRDQAHRGFSSFLPFLRRAQPTLMLHGHTHRYTPMQPTVTEYHGTTIVNVYGHALLTLEYSEREARWLLRK